SRARASDRMVAGERASACRRMRCIDGGECPPGGGGRRVPTSPGVSRNVDSVCRSRRFEYGEADGPRSRAGDRPCPERKPSGAPGGDHSRTMVLHTGTSGFSYAEWKGAFYPPGTKGADFLAYYATKLDTVEINNTFYRMPKRSVLAGWREKVPPEFVFVLKASRRITHHAKLED